MSYTSEYSSPLGVILIACDDEGLTGLWFKGQKYFPQAISPENNFGNHPVLLAAARWLDAYFSGRDPGCVPPLHPTGTKFQMEVWDIIRKIPYGKTSTYGSIAEEMAARRGGARISARAVGGAVAHNPVSIIVPCHRVVGKDGGLTGYAGGLERKKKLLYLESCAGTTAHDSFPA